MTCLPAGILPSFRALSAICFRSSPMVSDRQVVLHGDYLRIVQREDVRQRLEHVRLAAEHRGTLGERAGGRADGFLVVAGQGAAVIGAAALGAVAVRQAAVDAERRVHGADGLAGLGRVDGQGLALGDFLGGMSE